jgi:hypothetical protein
MRDIVDCWIDDYAHTIEESLAEQKEWEERCEQAQYELRQISKLIEFKTELLNNPAKISEFKMRMVEKFIDNLNIDIRIFKENWDA